MFDLGLDDTAYPFLLFLSQAETERVLGEYLAAAGVPVERGVELAGLSSAADAATAALRHRDGREEAVSARYVAGCDGGHSSVRRLAGIRFEGSSYPQTFVLADTEADGVEPGAAHVFVSQTGMLFFFPLITPATWRLLAMRPPADRTPPDTPVARSLIVALSPSVTICQRAPLMCRLLAPAVTSRSCWVVPAELVAELAHGLVVPFGEGGAPGLRIPAITAMAATRFARAALRRTAAHPPRWLPVRSVPWAGQPEERFLMCPRHDFAMTRRPILDGGWSPCVIGRWSAPGVGLFHGSFHGS